MKTLQQMLRELTRAQVSEFAVATDRLPCVKLGETYEPVDDVPRGTDEILEMLVSAGGSRYVEELEAQPAQWTTRIDGVGSVGVTAIMRAGRVQARFTLLRRASEPPPPARGAPPPARGAPPPARGAPPPVPAARVVPPQRPGAGAVAVAAPPVEVASDPILRAAVVRSIPSPAPAVPPRHLDEVLAVARQEAASDLHLVAGRPVLLRVAGELNPRGPVLDAASVEALVAPVVPEHMRAALAEHGSSDFAIERATGRFRVNVSRQRTGLKACFRCIPAGVPTLASLGVPAEIERATHHHQGLVLVTGPTGHGKTSTMSAIVDIINTETTHHIITVEDPVEFVHRRKKAMISQREVGSHTRSFQSALKASLREDPDVIVVGELRDTETVRMALAASETGHLVLGTMNTPSAAKTIDRLIDLFPPADQQQVRMTLAGGLHLIVSQRLLPRADGSGMVAAVELLPGSVALWSLIRDAKTFQIPSLQQRGKGFGIIRLDESLAELVRSGTVTKAAALTIAEHPEELDAVLSGKRQAPAPAQFGKKAP
jgi:twitching motility protein PilT